MKRLFPLLVVLVLAACNGPKPTVLITPPAVTPSLVPSIVPSLVPSAIPSPASVANTPTSGPTRVPAPFAPASILLPGKETIVDLGSANSEGYYNPRSMALDTAADRLYVSMSPSRTVVLDANSLTLVDELPVGGALSVDAQLKQLYVGVPGLYLLNPDGTYTTIAADLQLFDAADLKFLRRLTLSDTSTLPPLVEIDPQNKKAYLVQDGITIADATTLETLGTLSGTFAVPGAPGPNYSAVDAAIDPQRQRLWVSLNNNIPGSNGGTVLSVYDLTTGQVINQDRERSVLMMAIDPQTGQAVIPHAHSATNATVKYDEQGNILTRLDGASGPTQIDLQYDRVYVLESGDPWRVTVLDRGLNFLGVIDLPDGAVPQDFMLDVVRDRLLILQTDGRLLVLKGHGQPIAQPLSVTSVPQQTVQWIVPDLSDHTDQTLLTAFGLDEFNVGHGTLYRSSDTGATWGLVNGFPVDAVSDLKFAGHEIFAAVGNTASPNGYGIWRSDDGGQTWLPSSHGLTELGITRLTVSPDFARDGTLFALSKRGMFRSTDRGETWTSLADHYAPLLKDLTVSFNSLALSPNFAQDGTLLIGHTSGLWRSTDRGETWTTVSGGPATTRLAYAPNGSIVLAADYQGVHRSDDSGLTWQLFNTGLDLNNRSVTEVQSNDREAVVLLKGFGEPGMIYRRPLSETVWQHVPIDLDVTALTLLPDGGLLLGTADGRVQRLD
jgi:photosystem II stability/assembly factor-like uncharacterized protein